MAGRDGNGHLFGGTYTKLRLEYHDTPLRSTTQPTTPTILGTSLATLTLSTPLLGTRRNRRTLQLLIVSLMLFPACVGLAFDFIVNRFPGVLAICAVRTRPLHTDIPLISPLANLHFHPIPPHSLLSSSLNTLRTLSSLSPLPFHSPLPLRSSCYSWCSSSSLLFYSTRHAPI